MSNSVGRERRPLGILAVLILVGLLSAIWARPEFDTRVVVEAADNTDDVAAEAVTPNLDDEGNVLKTAGRSGRSISSTKAGCDPRLNLGSTDVGVSDRSIRLGATVVDSGLGSAFLSDVRHGMRAVLNRVNSRGGVCGRRIELLLKDDGWEAQRGFDFLRALVEDEKVFALAVVPSSEGLHVASTRGYLRERGIPVVGTDGMLVSQYIDPMIWPVAAATISTMHIMVKHAFDTGARNFAIVYDLNYRFGVEGAYAFNASVKRLTGRDVPGYSDPLKSPKCDKRFCAVKAGQESYGTELERFKSACFENPTCDYIVYLLEPDTAQKWMTQGGISPGYIGSAPVAVGGPQPLFNRNFGVNCAQACHEMLVWTGFKPPIEGFANEPEVVEYVNDVRAAHSGADVHNSFVEGGYIGMKLLVHALESAGSNLTRTSLAHVLNQIQFETKLARALTFTSQNRFANRCMMAFSIQSRPSFAGWRQATPDWICDPWVGEDIPLDLR